MRKFIFYLLIQLSTALLIAEGGVSTAEIIEDFEYLVRTLESSHPDPYTAFGGKIAFYRRAQEIRQTLGSSEMNTMDCFFLFSGFISNLHDGHTFISLPEEFKQSGEDKILPIGFRVVQDAIFIDKALDEFHDLIGSKLIMIHESSLDALLERVQLFRPCENRFSAGRNFTRMIRELNTAKYLFPRLEDALQISLITPEGKYKNIMIPFRFRKNREGKFASKATPVLENMDCPFGYRVISDKKVGYFAFNHVFGREAFKAIPQSGVESYLNYIYKRYPTYGPRPENVDEAVARLPSLIESFTNLLEEMKENHSSHLIIDLRYNGGGMTPITIPLLYLLYGDKYFAFDCKAEYNTLVSPLFLKKFNLTIEEFNKSHEIDLKVGDYNFDYFYSNDTSLTIEERRDAYIKDSENAGKTWHIPMLRNEALYTPKIIAVTSAGTFSAAYHFMYFLKYIGGAVVAGTSPGQAGNAFMEVTGFELPNTGWKGSISNAVQVFFPDDEEMGREFPPDIPVKWIDFKKYDFDEHSEILYILDLIDQNRL